MFRFKDITKKNHILKILLIVIGVLLFLSACPQSPDSPLSEEDNYEIPLPVNGIGFVEPGNNNILYTGNILLSDDGIYKGQMLINQDGLIIYIGRSAENMPEAVGATKIICAYGLAVPGFIDSWRHTTYAGGSISSSSPDVTGERYDHRHEWRKGLNGHSQISYSNPNIPLWDEIGLIMTGTTTAIGTASETAGSGGLVRQLKSGSLSGGLINDDLSNEIDTFPLGDITGEMSQLLGYDYAGDLPTWPQNADNITYSLIISEGINAEARNEFLTLSNTDLVANTTNILTDTVNIVHGLGLKTEDYKLMVDAGSSLVWTPRSDLFLYGNTAMVTVFDTLGGNITLGSTWSISGSINTLLEIQTAAFFNQTYLNNYFSDLDIINMATLNAAKAFKIDYKVGSLEVGKIADFTIFDTRDVSGFDAVLDADQSKITLVFRAGTPLYGDTYLIDSIRPVTTGSETLLVNGCTKRIYTIEEIGKTIAQVEADASVTPIPLVYNASILNTKIVPERTGWSAGGYEYTGQITSNDLDGDGIENNLDNAPNYFNPVRPLDDGVQADSDGDGVGDVIDPTPLL